MSSYHMSYLAAPTPPSTPTFNIVQISQYQNQTKSSQYLQNPFSIDTNLLPVGYKGTITALDILSDQNQLTPINEHNYKQHKQANGITPYNPSESETESDTDQDEDEDENEDNNNAYKQHIPTLWPPAPPQITLYQTDSEWIQKIPKHSTTMDTDGEDDDAHYHNNHNKHHDIEREPSQSSLCCTLYPEETELRIHHIYVMYNPSKIYTIIICKQKHIKITMTICEFSEV